jgi:lipopolysaccharide biosynthesis glycosyltransferase
LPKPHAQLPAAPNALAFITDEGFATGFLTTFASALIASNLDGFNIYIGYDQTNPIDRTWKQVIQLCERFNFPIKRCQRTPIDFDQFKDYTAYSNGSHHTYGRHYLASIIQEPRLLYLDSDMLVLDDLSKLVEQFPAGAPLAAVQDRYILTHANDSYHLDGHKPTNDTSPYFNSGMLLIDTDAFKQRNVLEQFSALHPRLSKMTFTDQTFINVTVKDQWAQLPTRWNALTLPRQPSPLMDGDQTQGILHYVTREKPWTVACIDPANILWHCVARAIGVTVAPEIHTAIDSLIDTHLQLPRTRLKLKMHYYRLRKSTQRKAERTARTLDLHNQLPLIEQWLQAHQLGSLPEPFHR